MGTPHLNFHELVSVSLVDVFVLLQITLPMLQLGSA
jgi:hypothetical protein